jgi:hypothetical protein
VEFQIDEEELVVEEEEEENGDDVVDDYFTQLDPWEQDVILQVIFISSSSMVSEHQSAYLETPNTGSP